MFLDIAVGKLIVTIAFTCTFLHTPMKFVDLFSAESAMLLFVIEDHCVFGIMVVIQHEAMCCVAGRVAPKTCLPVLQRIGTAKSSSQILTAAFITPRHMASLHSPVASCSYQAARGGVCRSALLPRNTTLPTSCTTSFARFSTALNGSFLPRHLSSPDPAHDRQFGRLHETRQARCALLC